METQELLVRKIGTICFVVDEDGNDVSRDYADSLAACRGVDIPSFTLPALGYSGVFYPTDCLELAGENLDDISREERVALFVSSLPEDGEILTMRDQVGEQVALFEPFVPLKARTGYGQYEFNNKDDLYELWAKERLEANRPIAVQPKYDGLRLLIHWEGDRVAIYTEDKKRDRAEILPDVVAEVRNLPNKSGIMDVELVLWQEDQPIPRSEMIRVIVGKTPIKGEDVRINIHDVLYLDGQPLNTKPYSERLGALGKVLPEDKKHLRKAVTWTTKSKDDFMAALDKAIAYPGSEGAMVKTTDSDYPLHGRAREETADWGKLKMVSELHVKIIGRTRKPNPWPEGKRPQGNLQGDEALKAFRELQKDSQTFYYRCAIHDNSKPISIDSQHKLTPGNLTLKYDAEHEGGVWKGTDDPQIWEMAKGFEHREQGDWAYGNTYAIKLDPAPGLGDIITVAPILMRAWKDGDETHYSWTFPRVREYDPTRTKPDTIEDVEKIVDRSPKSLQKFVKPGPFGHPGAKSAMLRYILPRIPEHDTYVEPYCGSATVFFAKPEKAQKSVLGDTDPEIIAALRFVRDASSEDIDWIRKQSWRPSKGRWQFLKDQEPVRGRQRFYRFLYLTLNSWAKSPEKGFARSNQPASMTKEMDKIRAGAEKLSGSVTIVQQDAFTTMREHDSVSTFHYVDPPYFGSGDLVPFGGKAPEPEVLAKFLKGLRGKWLLSMADVSRVRKAFKGFNIKSVSLQMRYSVFTQKGSGQPSKYRRELLIANYDLKPSELKEADVPKGEGDEPSHKAQRTEAERKFGDPYLVHQPPDKKFPFVYMHHERGIWTSDELKDLRAEIAKARDNPDLIPDIWHKYKPVILTGSLSMLKRRAQEAADGRGDVSAAVHKFLNETVPKVLPPSNQILNVGNVHGDWRMKSPEGEFLIGYTVDTPSVVLQFLDGQYVYPVRDKFLDNKPDDKIVSHRKCPNPLCDEERYLELVESGKLGDIPEITIQDDFATLSSNKVLMVEALGTGYKFLLESLIEAVQPLVWLTIVNPRRITYWAPAGAVGATVKTGARFIFRDQGYWAAGCRKSDYHEGFFWFDKSKNLSGRWGAQLLPSRPEYTKIGTEGDWWMVNRVAKDSRPYILQHSRESKEDQAQEEKLKHIIWNADLLKVLRTDPLGRKWLGSIPDEKLDEKWEEYAAGDGEFHLTKALSFNSKLFHSPPTERDMYLYGPILIPGKTDAQEHHVTSEEIVKALRSMDDCDIDIQHGEEVPEGSVKLTQIFQAPANFKIGERSFKKGTAVAEIAVLSQEVRKRVLEGELTGFSIKGKGHQDSSGRLYNIQIDKISLVSNPAIREEFLIQVE